MNYLKVIQVIMAFFNNPEAYIGNLLKGQLGKLISRYVSQNLLTAMSGIKKVIDFEKYLDPKMIFKAIQRANEKEINQLLKEINLLNKDERNKALKSLNVTEAIPISLSSSWIKKGQFLQKANSINGTMILWIQSDKDPKHRWYGPYVYPHIDKQLWLLMKEAKGKNGTGAGSIMWKYFLHSWFPSAIRQYLIKNKQYYKKHELEQNIRYANRLSTKFSNLGTPQANKYKSSLIKERLSYKGQKSVIIANSKQELKQAKEKVINPLYTFTKTQKNIKKNINKVKRPINRIKRPINKIIGGLM